MPEPSAVPAPVRSYRDLRVWQQAMDLAEATYRATEQFPEHERYGLVNQLRRAAVETIRPSLTVLVATQPDLVAGAADDVRELAASTHHALQTGPSPGYFLAV